MFSFPGAQKADLNQMPCSLLPVPAWYVKTKEQPEIQLSKNFFCTVKQ